MTQSGRGDAPPSAVFVEPIGVARQPADLIMLVVGLLMV